MSIHPTPRKIADFCDEETKQLEYGTPRLCQDHKLKILNTLIFSIATYASEMYKTTNRRIIDAFEMLAYERMLYQSVVPTSQ